MTTTTTVTVVSDKPQTPEQISGRLLPVVTMSQQQIIQTTGRGHQEAKFASGTLTFYNAAPFVQFIPAGTLLIAQNGNQVVTDQDATLPAANMPIVGQVTVSAHAVVAGTAGNMQAGVIDSACCRVNIFAKNTTAFTGGQEARSFPMVTKLDIDKAASALKSSLLQSMQAAIQTQIKAHETLVNPLSCTPTVTPNHPVGAEATELTVTVSQTCKPFTYDTQAMQHHTKMLQTAASKTQFGEGYSLTPPINITIKKVAVLDEKQGILKFTVTATGTWVYQFSQEKLSQISNNLAGKTKEQATVLLLQTTGVDQVSCEEATATLPTDPGKIQLVVMALAGSTK